MHNQHHEKHKPNGLRRLSAASLDVQDLAGRFEGVHDGLTRGQVLSAFKRAAMVLEIHPRLVFAIDKLMSFSCAQDWEANRRPIVWPSNERLQEELGLGQRAVQYQLRQLIDAQLIAPVDSPTGKRYGHRDSAGYITEAYGFDLSPLAVRYAEFAALADEAEAARKERGQLRRKIAIAKNDILRISRAALEDGLEGGEWEAWAQEALEIAGKAVAEATCDTLHHLLEALEARREEAERTLRHCLAVADHAEPLDRDIAPSGAVDCTRNTTTTQFHIDKSNTTVDSRNPSPEQSRSLAAKWEKKNRDLDVRILVDDNIDQYRVTPSLVAYACPDITLTIPTQNPGWNDLLEAAFLHKQMLGISNSIWAEACRILGRKGATIVMAIVTTKQNTLKSPGGYFRGMINKAHNGKLNLGPTLYALRDRRNAQPELGLERRWTEMGTRC